MPDVTYKSGVSGSRISEAIRYAINIAESVYADVGKELVVTSTTEGQHKSDSLHYSGNAVDIRTRNLDTGQQYQVWNKIKTRLGKDYDVLLEGNHIHIEYDPKNPSKTVTIPRNPIPSGKQSPAPPQQQAKPNQAVGAPVSSQFRSAFILGVSIILLAVAFVKLK